MSPGDKVDYNLCNEICASRTFTTFRVEFLQDFPMPYQAKPPLRKARKAWEACTRSRSFQKLDAT